MGNLNRKYGWKKDKVDPRDKLFRLPRLQQAILDKVDLEPKMSPIYDQGSTSSCTGNAAAAGFDHVHYEQYGQFLLPSRLAIYLEGRRYEDSIDEDCGAMIRDVIKGIVKVGCIPETMWPFVESNVTKEPPKELLLEAEKHQAISYYRIPDGNLEMMLQTLSAGHPIVFGMILFNSFETAEVAKTGIVNLPGRGDKPVGGHAVVLVGFDKSTQRFIVRNSWGTKWGQNGYFTVPFSYISNSGLCNDFWVITKVEE